MGKLIRLLSVNRLSPTLLVLLAMDLLSNGSFAQEAQGATASDEETIRFGRYAKILKFCIWMPILYSCETATEGL